jgi:hypothetical protein
VSTSTVTHPRPRTTALLSWAIESWLRRTAAAESEIGPAAPEPQPQRPLAGEAWDVWWACTRAGLSATELGVSVRLDLGLAVEPDIGPSDLVVVAGCGRCVVDVTELTRIRPNDTIDPDAWLRCGCLAQWARRMRDGTALPGALPWARPWAPAGSLSVRPHAWRLSIAVVKPGTDPDQVRQLLASRFEILAIEERWLSDYDVYRLYPDAYGADFRRRQINYLTLQPVHVLVLVARARLTAQDHLDAKMEVRLRLGGTDDLRNHVHMADNPGEAWCDALHLVGLPGTQRLYERYGA